MKNPYSETRHKDTLSFISNFTQRALREMQARIWQEGYEAGYKMGYGDAVYIYDADSKKTIIVGL